MATASGNATSATEEDNRVAKVASKLRVFEDFGLAYRMQEEEFGNHYDHNRSERRLVGADTKKSKLEQELEDKYAAEYRAQVLRDLAEKDAEVAMRIQMELEKEEQRKREELARIDQEIALRIQTEEANDGYRSPQYDPTEDERLARQLQESLNASSSGASRGVDPYGFRPAVVTLPSGRTPELRQALNSAMIEEDKHYARYMQDRELAKHQHRQERVRQLLDSEEQRQNELNLAAASGRPVASVDGRRRSSTDSSGGGSSNAPPPPRPPPPKIGGLRRVDIATVDTPVHNYPINSHSVNGPPVANLISFDADDLPPPPAPALPLAPTNPFLQDLQNESFPPPPVLDGGAVGNSLTAEGRLQGGSDVRPLYKPPVGGIRVLPHHQ